MKEQDIFKLFHNQTCIDVRSPIEFVKGHIPNAKNIFLFTDEDRGAVGTLYKQKGRQAAIEEGLKRVDLNRLHSQIKSIGDEANLLLYCARGGMRSLSISFLFTLLERRHTLLAGGYKTFRNWALTQFKKNYRFKIIAGKTCTGKTEFLKKLSQEGRQVIDLEKLANHFGSAFGGIEKIQPSQEQFENEMSVCLAKFDPDKAIYMEDESRMIGKIVLPLAIFEQMRKASCQTIEDSFENRVKRCMDVYGSYEKEHLKSAVLRLSKKLGSERTKNIIAYIDDSNYERAIVHLFEYYDKYYEYSLQKRKKEN